MDDLLASTLRPGSGEAAADGEAKTPGLLQIWVAGQPAFRAIPIDAGSHEFGREHPVLRSDADPLMSRRHARITYAKGQFLIEDLGSSNGTAVDGITLAAGMPQVLHRLVRMGGTLCIPITDVAAFGAASLTTDGESVRGPATHAVLAAAARAAQLGDTLLINGESGAGKESVARAFHAGSGTAGRFVAVNCATIPEGIAERLLFGAKRGAYSGADADSEGYLQAADGGTLFLDEIGDLDLLVQAKLLRVLENKEILPVGATRPRAVKVRVCSATHKDLRAQVAAGRMREDVFFRLAQSQLAVLPLRRRLEEMPWLLKLAVSRMDTTLKLGVSFVESCLLRVWPGNIRELLAEARSAAQTALAAGSRELEVKHLRDSAGSAFTTAYSAVKDTSSPKAGPPPDRQAVESALERVGGNIKEAALLLKLHRTQLYRLIDRYGITVKRASDHGA